MKGTMPDFSSPRSRSTPKEGRKTFLLLLRHKGKKYVVSFAVMITGGIPSPEKKRGKKGVLFSTPAEGGKRGRYSFRFCLEDLNHG